MIEQHNRIFYLKNIGIADFGLSPALHPFHRIKYTK